MSSTAVVKGDRVRVELEGSAKSVHGGVVVVELDEGPRIAVSDDWRGVSVERETPARQWADGDVVQHPTAGWTLTREHGCWVNSKSRALWDDEDVTGHVDGERGHAGGWEGPLRVLRYQHDECDDGQHWLDDRTYVVEQPAVAHDPDVVTWRDIMLANRTREVAR